MTRANLNFVFQSFIFPREGETSTTLYHYHNGDQYPSGLRDCYHIEELLKDLTPEGFKKWIRKNYDAKAVGISHPCIYYDQFGFITDYSYIFEEERGYIDQSGKRVSFPNIRVYNWDELIFSGTTEEFRKWLKGRKKFE